MIETGYTLYKPHGAYLRLSNDYFTFDTDDESGVIKGLYFKDDINDANFMGHEENQRIDVAWRGRYVKDMHHRAPMQAWTGDITLKVRKSGSEEWSRMFTMFSNDIRSLTCDDESITTTYEGYSQYDGGLKDLRIVRVYTLKRDVIEWSFSIENQSAAPITVGELGLPVILNTNTTLGTARDGLNHRSVKNEEFLNENRVVQHYFVSGHSSCIYASRYAGIGDILVLMPTGGTFLEAVTGENLYEDTDLMSVSGLVFYLYSKATVRKPWYNGHRELALAPGESKTFSFAICRAKSFPDVHERIYELGGVDTKVLPGMVLPRDGRANILLRTKKPIHSVAADPGVTIEKTGELGSRQTYSVAINEEGERKVTIHYGAGEWMNLVFYGTRPLEELIDSRGAFISDHQRVTDPDDKCRFSFRSWDNDTETMVDGENVPCGIMDLGGSDDRNFSPPLFLVEKNVYYPEERQIEILDEFVEKFLYGVLQDRESFQVLNCVYDSDETYALLKGTKSFATIAGFLITDENGKETTWRDWSYPWRIYNYPYPMKTYYDMYRIAKRFGTLVTRKPREYLLFAYKTAMAMFADSTYANTLPYRGFQDHDTGNLYRSHAPQGAWILGEILPALQTEGMADEYDTLRETIIDVSTHYSREKYAVSAEYMSSGASPNTAGSYLYAQVADDPALKTRLIDSILASRDDFPAWFCHGTFNRFVGSYMTSHMAYPLFDQFMRTGDDYKLRLAYGGILAMWTCVDATGHGYNTREWRFNPPEQGHPEYHYYRNGCQSGELGVGLHRDFSLLISTVVRDIDFGLIGLGCDVSESDDAYTIKPWSGFGFRAYVAQTGIMIDNESFKMDVISMAKDGSRIEITPSEGEEGLEATRVIVSGLEPGRYGVAVGDEQRIESTDGRLVIVSGVEAIRIERIEIENLLV